MNSKNLLSLFAAGALLLGLAGCIGTPVKFQDVEAGSFDAAKGHPVVAQSCGFQLLFLIPINTNSRQQKAYNWLVKQAGNDSVVTDIKIQERWFYGLVGTGYCTRLEGTAYPKLVAAIPTPEATGP